MNRTVKTTDYTLTFSKNYGRLWMLDDITPYYTSFQKHFADRMGGDYLKVTVCGASNRVLDALAGGETQMNVELKISAERVKLPGYVELQLVDPGRKAARYLVNGCPGAPQLIAWVNASIKEIIGNYPTFAYIRKKE